MIRVGWKFANPNVKIASVRIRGFNIIEHINKNIENIEVEFFKHKDIKKYNIVIFSKTYSEEDILTAKHLKKEMKSVFFDICDNHFILGGSRVHLLDEMLKLSDKIVVSTSSLKEIILKKNVNPDKILVIPDAIDTFESEKDHCSISHWIEHLKLKRFLSRINTSSVTKEHRIIWFGNSIGSNNDSGMLHLNNLKDLLFKLNTEIPISLTVLSNSKKKYKTIFSSWQIPTFYYDWNISTYEQVLKQHGITIIPINVNDFTIAKTNNRIVTSILSGLNVVADEIPSYKEFKEFIYLNDWDNGLRTYLTNPSKGNEHLALAKKFILENYNIDKISDQWVEIFNQNR
ncbi:MAG: hypothetical protein IE931_08965 [Sphingobacteriales bacterium]|nr:hypothetical protein [Sphingobacteriales bacterium]